MGYPNRIGRTVHLRVNPKDCMSVVDICDKLGVFKTMPHVSFAQVVSIALSSAIESLRQGGVIPEREGFEFNEVMSIFPESSAHRKKKMTLAVSHMLHSAGSEFQIPAAGKIVPKPAMTVEQRRRKIRMDELHFKMEADPDNVSQAEKDEWTELVAAEFDGESSPNDKG